MIAFFDESFRQSLLTHHKQFGILCGVAIPEREVGRISRDVFQIKKRHMGLEFAKEGEIKGKELLSNYAFKMRKQYGKSKNIMLAEELLTYIAGKKLCVFGCVCFEKEIQNFQCGDVISLDKTFRYLFERLDMFMKIEHPRMLAKIVFDDRDYGTNRKNSEAITNFFQRSDNGQKLDSIVHTPFFAISQAHNVGLQFADLVTTVVGLRFASHPEIGPLFEILKRCFYHYEKDGQMVSSLKVLRGF